MPTNAEIRIENSGGESFLGTVLHTVGRYAVADVRGHQIIAKQALGAWRELPLHEAIGRLDLLERT